MNYVDLKSTAGRSVTKSGEKNKKNRFPFITVFIVLALAFLVVNGARIKKSLAQALNPVSIVTTVAGVQGTKIKESDGRTNILILGTDQRTMGDLSYSQLTDSIMLISVGKAANDGVLVSIPRDLWVQSSTGGYHKINELYGVYGGKGDGTKEVLTSVETVLGIPVHYYGVINFALFKQVIDILGGVDVTVDNSFTDNLYPIEGKENAMPESERYETISFTQGTMKMDGETALKYARSRHGDNGEGTDFARARRQQNIIKAVKQKALSAQTLLDFSKVKSLYDLYSKNMDTNMDISSLQLLFSLFQSSHFDNVRNLVLDDRSDNENGGLLYAPTDLTLYGGRYVLIPKSGDYSQIHAYIQKYLFN